MMHTWIYIYGVRSRCVLKTIHERILKGCQDIATLLECERTKKCRVIFGRCAITEIKESLYSHWLVCSQYSPVQFY